MSDIRFKISGDSAPFIAQLYSAGDVLLQQKAIDYSGVCSIFGTSCSVLSVHNGFNTCSYGMLYPNTCYKFKVTDSIGYSVCSGFTTPVQVGTTTLASKSICLSGYTLSTLDGLNCFGTGNVVFSPVLSCGESVALKFAFSNCCYSRVTNSVSISCKPNGESNYVCIISDATQGVKSCVINMNYGDALCYSLSTILQENTNEFAKISGCSTIKISGYTANSGFNPIINSNEISTSITCLGDAVIIPPDETSITVYMGAVCVQNCSTSCGLISVCAKLCTSPPLTIGQSFNLSFATNATSSYGDNSCPDIPQECIVDAYLPHRISACAFGSKQGSTCACVCSYISAGSAGGYMGPICSGTLYNINCDNIDTIVFCSAALSYPANDSLCFTNCARLDLCGLPVASGGNFVLSPNQTLYAYSPTNNHCGCANGPNLIHGGGDCYLY